MKKKYKIKYKYNRVQMNFIFFAKDELDALKQFLHQAERFKLPINSNINLLIKVEDSENEEWIKRL